MRVIGTAGHVDHGKSTLIAALTGIHPDRLKEEQAREMTIELGFGWMNLPNGEEIGIIDVPGHRDFIENMLSGIGGIDAALLIIAADEGVMPQTREHLSILDLLEIPTGLIVLTKIDLATDPTWLDLIESDIRSLLKNTRLQDASIIRASAKEKTGLDELKQKLQDILLEKPQRPNLNRPRLPVDRSFTISGFGAVVTGTLLDGQLTVGEDVEILPTGLTGRIRGLETHKKKEEVAVPGSRTAVNISGISSDQIKRGSVVVYPGQYSTTRRVDASIKIISDASKSIEHGEEVKLFVGATESIANLRLLGTDALHPGETGWIQLEFRNPIVTVRGDHFIIRRPSPGETMGGGKVIDPNPKGRHKRFDQEVLKSLESLSKGSPADILRESVAILEIASIKDLIVHSRMDDKIARSAIKDMINKSTLISLNNPNDQFSDSIIVMLQSDWELLYEKVRTILKGYHISFPLRRGISREELKSRLKFSSRIFTTTMEKFTRDRLIIEGGTFLALPGHEVRFDGKDQAKVDGLTQKFRENPFSTPSVKDCQNEVGEDVFSALIDMKELVLVSQDVVFARQDYEKMIHQIREAILQQGSIQLSQVRDMFKTSRKYAQALLEHMDTIGITIREGDNRKLKSG